MFRALKLTYIGGFGDVAHNGTGFEAVQLLVSEICITN